MAVCHRVLSKLCERSIDPCLDSEVVRVRSASVAPSLALSLERSGFCDSAAKALGKAMAVERRLSGERQAPRRVLDPGAQIRQITQR